MTDLRISKAQNLARIRDNQRRSRARRKEYLQELEAKLRGYEQMGIEASSEIQTAARKVLEENKKLRSLLQERGISDPEIALALGNSSDRSSEKLPSASNLSNMLERRIACEDVIVKAESPASTEPRCTPMTQHQSSIPPLVTSAPRSVGVGYCDSPSPSSAVSSTGTPPPLSQSTTLYPSSTNYLTTNDIKTESSQYDYTFPSTYDYAWNLGNHYSQDVTPVTYHNISSCVAAANIISTMRSDAAPELGPDMSRRIPNQHCYTGNNMMYQMMERYSPLHHTM